jgi:hypothetical protein
VHWTECCELIIDNARNEDYVKHILIYRNDMRNPSAYITPVVNLNVDAFSKSIEYPLALLSKEETDCKRIILR